jgi:hypothetical protein
MAHLCIRDVGALRRQHGGEYQLIRRIIGLRAIFPEKGDGLCLALLLCLLRLLGGLRDIGRTQVIHHQLE